MEREMKCLIKIMLVVLVLTEIGGEAMKRKEELSTNFKQKRVNSNDIGQYRQSPPPPRSEPNYFIVGSRSCPEGYSRVNTQCIIDRHATVDPDYY